MPILRSISCVTCISFKLLQTYKIGLRYIQNLELGYHMAQKLYKFYGFASQSFGWDFNFTEALFHSQSYSVYYLVYGF